MRVGLIEKKHKISTYFSVGFLKIENSEKAKNRAIG